MYNEAKFNFHEALKDNGIEMTARHERLFKAMFLDWELNDQGNLEELYGDGLMYPGKLYNLVMNIVDEY